jgi:hypothetical protein
MAGKRILSFESGVLNGPTASKSPVWAVCGRYGRVVDRLGVTLGSDVMFGATALAIFIFSGAVMILMSHVH